MTISTAERDPPGWPAFALYLSPILDLHNGYLVSYTISDRSVLGMITSMLEKAFETIPDGTEVILYRIKANRKSLLPVIHRQQALSTA